MIKKFYKLLEGKIPIYEPGLKELLDKNVNENRLSFSNNLEDCIGDSNSKLFKKIMNNIVKTL